MNDPDDTDPTRDEAVVDTDPGPGPTEDTVPDERDEGADQDSDEFWQWLPTMGLAYRRRKELVERRSSDGAPFAAYAGATRPTAAAPALRFDAKVRIASEWAEAEAQGARDALTVVTPRRGRRSPAMAVGLAAVAAVSVTVAFTGRSYLPAWRQAHEVSTGRGAAPSPALREPFADSVLRGSSVASPTEPPLPTGTAPAASATAPRAERPSPLASEPPHPRQRSAPSRAADPPARRGAPPSVSAASLTKDQFFEAP